MRKPIAICYLGKDGDGRNVSRLYSESLEVIKDGRSHEYTFDDSLFLTFSQRKWMLPLIVGGILASLSVLLIFRQLISPWWSLLILFGALYIIYVGWLGTEGLLIKHRGSDHFFPIQTKNLRIQAYANFIHGFVKNPKSAIIYHFADPLVWGNAEDYYQPESLEKEGFVHCSTDNQLLDTYSLLFAGKSEIVVLLTIDAFKIESELKYELAPDRHELFPHIYGAINKGAVVGVAEIKSQSDLQTLIT